MVIAECKTTSAMADLGGGSVGGGLINILISHIITIMHHSTTEAHT